MRRLSPFLQSFARDIALIDQFRSRLTLNDIAPFPVLRKPEVVFNGQTVAYMSMYCIKVE